jgi:putative membrane protein
MKKFFAMSTAVVAGSLAFAPLAGAQESTQQHQLQRAQQAAQNAEQQAQGAAGQAKQDMSQEMMSPDQHFVKEAAADNQFEIKLSQFVEQQAQDPQVKQLAQKLIQDHQQAQQQLQKIAQGMNMQLPSQLEQWQQDKLQAMQQKHGKHLEMHYTFGNVGDHTTDLLMYQYEAEHGQNQQVKQFAEQTIPILQQHLQMAEQVAQQWVPQARTAGEHMQGSSASPAPSASKAGSSTNQEGTPSNGSSSGAK